MEPGVSMASRPLRFFPIRHYAVCSVCLLGRGNRTTIVVSDVRDFAPLVLLATTLPSETFRAPIPFLRSPNPISKCAPRISANATHVDFGQAEKGTETRL